MASISSSTSTPSSITAKTGIGGLVSGMDIDALVESLSATSRQKVLKQQQNVQKFEWKQLAYRSTSSILKDFQSKYLDVLSTSSLRSANFFKTVTSTSSSAALSVSPTASASTGIMTIDNISQLATNQKISSILTASKPLSGKMVSSVAGTMDDTDISNLLTNLTGKSILLTLDGKSKTITFDEAFKTDVNTFIAPETLSSSLQSSLQTLVDNAFGGIDAGRVISVNITNDQLSFSAPGSTLTINSIDSDISTLENLGLVSGQSNKINLNESLENTSFSTSLDLTNNEFTFKINAVDFTFNNSDSVALIMNKINSSNAGVNLAYSSITDKFSITANESGAGDNIVISESSGNLITTLGLAVSADPLVSPEVTDGLNALLSVNGQNIIRSSNNIEIDGLKITLIEKSATAVTINSIRDSSALVAPITKFVEDYNTMIEAMNKSIKEEVYRDFPPLSDKQKADMSETEIKNWDEKAKSGLLRGDTIIRGITSKLQSAMSGHSVNGIYLFNLGITSVGYTENGKLKIDETKLISALNVNTVETKELFTSENGLGNLLNNIITDAVKTSGPQGSRGSLVEAAGIISTLSESQNYLTDSMTRTNKIIKTLETRLKDEESRLWKKFTAMEQALQRLNSQSSYISQFSVG